jgi:hypothetical protein
MHYLVLIFFVEASFVSSAHDRVMTTAVIPEPYATREACLEAGYATKRAYNGGADITWTCSPADAAHTTETANG